jgi:hypothetical protein
MALEHLLHPVTQPTNKHLVRRRHYHAPVCFLNDHYSSLLKEMVIWMDCRAAQRTQLQLTETQLINPKYSPPQDLR